MIQDFLDKYPYLLPLIIFFGRILDVTLGTMRIILVSKGAKYKAPLVGFFEVFIWIVIISQILSRANGILAYISYAAGYATGNFVGILVEERIAYGIILFRVYTQKECTELINILKAMGHGSTLIKASGTIDKVNIIETVINRKEMSRIEKTLINFDPNIFYLIEDIRTRKNGIFQKKESILQKWRIGK